MKKFWLNFVAASVGNLFEHYDKALFAFLAPFMASLFFHSSSPITALILTYAIMLLGLFSRPLGSLIFGRMGDRKGRKNVLLFTLLGMALTTILMGSIPFYEKIGWLAPTLLALGRLFQNFFASGETIGGTLLVLESCPKKKRGLMNGLYECSTILGTLLASLGVTILSVQGSIETRWRILYWIGGITGGVGLLLRLYTEEEVTTPRKHVPIVPLLWKYRVPFIVIVMTSGLSYAHYYMLTSLLNGYLPLVSTISKSEATQANTLILGFDFLILPLGGILTLYFSKEKLLYFFGGLIVILAFPFYSSLSGATLGTATFIRLIFVIIGVGFSVVLAPFYQDLIPRESRFTLIAFGNAIGSQLLGTSACPLSFWLFKKTDSVGSPAFYLMGLGIVTLLSVRYVQSLQRVSPSVLAERIERS
ncbi:MAG: MFS transporter [Simkaniaceae bacterium]|nr:MFS transporter [Simkaniaceae bacterium]